MIRFFHGGFGGLRVGDLVRPPEETGAASLANYGSVGRADRVYVTTCELTARVYAALHPSHRGKVYEVEPVGELEVDPDCKVRGMSFSVPRARVIRVIQVSKEEQRQLIHELIGAQS